MTRLRLGRHLGMKMPGSMIVGPGAVVQWADKTHRKVVVLPPSKIVSDFTQPGPRSQTADIEVIHAASTNGKSKASPTSPSKRRS
jgi:hypothetical protein